MSRILIVEDDEKLNRGTAFVLKHEGYDVISAFSLKEAESFISKGNIDFLLLDITLPDGNGLEFCKKIRRDFLSPIVFFTANDTEEDMVRGFQSGCDDYLAKPFSLEVLKYKVNAMLKRVKQDNDIFEYKGLKINFNKMLVSVDEKEVKLTTTEYKLLELLIKNKGKVMTKEVILERLWDIKGRFVDENTLSVNIRRLRKKIERDSKNPCYVITVFGIGYIFGE